MANASPTILGYDPTITFEGERRFLSVGDISYEILKTEFIGDMIRGRGTVCFHVSRGDKEYVVKDSWVDTGHSRSERDFLKSAGGAGVTGVPKFIADTIVQVNGRDDLTSWARACIEEKDRSFPALKFIDTRKHQRLLIEPFAVPLVHFKSKFELLSVLRDAIRSKSPLLASVLQR